jgi:hypothetical protein
MFPGGDLLFVPRAFGWAIDCFGGHYADYQAIDVPYHDLEHTLQGTLCFARLLQCRQEAGSQPALTQTMFEWGLLAILLHDTGYLKRRDDLEGTGAKYTLIHVDRSAEFAARLLAQKGFSDEAIQAVQNMIHCTGVRVRFSAIPFASQLEQIVGCALGTADYMGQMAAGDYLEKLPELYLEFEESARFLPDKTFNHGSCSSAKDLVSKTPAFWENYVRPRLDQQYQGLYRFLNQPYPDGPNHYLQRIEANLARLRQQLACPCHVA